MEVTILVGKLNIYEDRIFPKSLVKTCWLETTYLCLNTRLSVNKFFQILIIFIKIKLTVWLLFSHPIMTCILFRTRRSNTQEKVSYILNFYVSADVHQEHVFPIAPFRSMSNVLKNFGCLGVSNRVSNLNEGKILIFVGSILQKC